MAQEDKDAASHGKILAAITSGPRFEIGADLGHRQTRRYHRTTTYLLDGDGVVREVFPMTVRQRAPWTAVLAAFDRLNPKSG